ncbi:MAG: aspartate ammonia-lyase [Acidobacteria bacterium]|nr:aspartate ammonia-lyase [Acidobacteriota bacterium]
MSTSSPDAFRTERDTLGEMKVPTGALYGAQTARAVENFPISGWRLPSAFLDALARIKSAFATANREAGLLSDEVAGAIADAAEGITSGQHLEEFPVDVFQTGSGTSTNMNMNEVLAHIANVALGGDPVAHKPVHPNDHVNLGQSSNDSIPAALRVSTALVWRDLTRPAIERVVSELESLAGRHGGAVTLGRTHLMDAVPTTYGRVFGQWAQRLQLAIDAAQTSADGLLVLPLGGTAVGTGLGSQPGAVRRAVELLAEGTRLGLTADARPAVGISAQDAPIRHADALASIGRVLLAIGNDLRLRGSGPFGGLGELNLPAVQPGSSIMPGKVNPVIPEAVVQVALQVEGLAATCRASALLHQLDLSHANPLLAWNLDTSARLLAHACTTLVERCLKGLTVNTATSRAHAAASPAMATALARALGYEAAAKVAKEAEASGSSVAVTARRLQVLPDQELDKILDLDRMAGVTKGDSDPA